MEQNAYFRAGAGAVIYRPDGTIVIFERSSHPAGVWQLQQGGIDEGEEPETTLWRELAEETGCRREDFATVAVYPRWTTYEYPATIRQDPENPYPNRLGQAHRWWFLELRDGADINLENATDKEFSQLEWVTFQTLLDRTSDFKYPVYEELRDYFEREILKP